MTDQSRTLAGVKRILADNNHERISAQDMRDVVESIVNPIPGGGFDVRYSQLAGGYYGDPSLSIPLIAPDRICATYHVPTTDEDPGGWFRDTPYDSPWWGITFPTWLMLPPGFYMWSIYANFHNDHLTSNTGTIDGFMEHLDDTATLDHIHGGRLRNQAYGQNLYKLGVGNAADNAEGHQAQGFVRVPEVDTLGVPVTGQRFGCIYRMKDNPDMRIDYRSLIVAKIK